jgi:hypothetical protein
MNGPFGGMCSYLSDLGANEHLDVYFDANRTQQPYGGSNLLRTVPLRSLRGLFSIQIVR